MKYEKAVRNSAEMELPRDTMCLESSAAVPAAAYVSVAIMLAHCAEPQPTRAEFGALFGDRAVRIYLRPEAISKGDRVAVAGEKPHRMPFDKLPTGIRPVSKSGLVSTTALTKTEGYGRLRIHES